MPKTRGGKGSRCPKRVADTPPSTGPAPPKRQSSRITTGLAKRPWRRRLKPTVTISDTTTSFGNRSAQIPYSSASPVSSPTVPGSSPPATAVEQPEPSSTQLTVQPTRLLDSVPVKNVQITLGRSVLESIFGPKFINTAPSNLTCKHAKDLCLSQQNETPPYHVLFVEPRLLHYVFVRVLYPKDHSKEATNEIVLEAIYRLMTGSSVDYACLILDHMYRVACMTHAYHLPYGNLLTHVFQHFQVPLESEECVTQSVPIISASSLKTLWFYKIEHRGWQHSSDLTSTKAAVLKVTLPDTFSAPNVATVIAGLPETTTTLRQQLDQVQMDIGLMNKKIDSLIHLISLIHYGAQLAIPFQITDIAHATQSAEQIIRSTSSTPNFR
ncbi:hypothetical protein Cgig2_032404 [Carnegiea gigantea]|uniref:Uncharacterized protein n=1 Tax=Carnegiea gigantea TaxID=171969 RepID=A0A9Q1GHA6_9CARY|nr:hypothetical protein Cgig2_032404 [Carnegiea gigantea]